MIMEELKEVKREIANIKKIKEDYTYMSLISLIKLIIVLWILSVSLIVGGFLLYFNQFEIVTETSECYEQTVDTEGDASEIYQNIGGVINGES